MSEILKELMIQLVLAYLQIVVRKHGITPVASDKIADLSHDDLATLLESLRDLAHLPSK